MADETVSIQLLIDTSKSATNMAELEESIEAMREELRKTEIGSQQFDKLARSIQQAENKVKDIELTYESADLEGRFGRLGDVIGGVARGAAAVEGALFLMGEQGEEAEEVMGKLMSAMAIADSIEGFAKLGSALQKFTSITAITEKAQLALGVAIRASNRKEFIGSIRDMGKSLLGMSKSTNLAAIAKTALAGAIKGVRIAFTVLLGPIGWVIAGVTALGAVVYKFREQIESVVRAIPGLSDALEWLGLISSEQELAAQKAVDAAKKEIDAINEKIKAIEKARDQELEAIDDTIREIDRELKVRGAAGEDVSALERTRIEQILERVRVEKEATEQIIKLRQQEIAELRKLDSNFYRAGADALEKFNKERIEKVEELGEKEKDLIADLTAFDIKKQKEAANAYAKAQEERTRKLNEEIQKQKQALTEFDQWFNEELKKQKQRRENEGIDDVTITVDLPNQQETTAAVENTLGVWENYVQRVKAGLNGLTENQVNALAGIEMTATALGNSLTSLSELLGSETKKGIALQKAAAVTQLLIDTARSISAVIAGATAAAAAGGPAAPFLLVGYITSGIATVLSSIAQAKAILSQAGASVGGTGGGGGVGLRGPNSPGQANMLPATGETVLRGNQMDTKVVVVESDITNVQSRVNVIENQAKVR